tara:strand:+ start:723 stop:1655 length:933 start_codon:yes stop_codon:yes gene_type:complete
MVTFFRIFDDTLYSFQREHLGFSSDDPFYIPDEYLDNLEFVVMRTCHGIGDWVLLSSMPRLLKQKYPHCKVYIPSKVMLEKVFGNMLNSWGYNTFKANIVPEIVFKNNPYVDGFVDKNGSEIFHDHYKIFDKNKDEIPLIEQMLKFWQFTEDELQDTSPDFYPTDKEHDWFFEFNKFEKYGYLLASSSIGNGDPVENLLSAVDKHKKGLDNWYYYGESEFENSVYKNMGLKNIIELKSLGLSVRQQQYLKTKAEVNFGNETGMSLWTSKYSKSYVLGHTTYTAIHGEGLVGKKRERPFNSGNFVREIEYV